MRVNAQTPEEQEKEKRERSAMGGEKQRVRVGAHIIETELVLGQLDDVVADLLVSRERLGSEPLDVFDGVLPAGRGLRWRQGCHRRVCREPKIQVGREGFCVP